MNDLNEDGCGDFEGKQEEYYICGERVLLYTALICRGIDPQVNTGKYGCQYIVCKNGNTSPLQMGEPIYDEEAGDLMSRDTREEAIRFAIGFLSKLLGCA